MKTEEHFLRKKTELCNSIRHLFLIPELRVDLSVVEEDFFSVAAVELLSFDFAMDFHIKVLATSSEKLITPVDGLI